MSKTYIELRKAAISEEQNGPSEQTLLKQAQAASLATQKAILDTQEALSEAEANLASAKCASPFDPKLVVERTDTVNQYRLGLKHLKEMMDSLFSGLPAPGEEEIPAGVSS